MTWLPIISLKRWVNLWTEPNSQNSHQSFHQHFNAHSSHHRHLHWRRCSQYIYLTHILSRSVAEKIQKVELDSIFELGNVTEDCSYLCKFKSYCLMEWAECWNGRTIGQKAGNKSESGKQLEWSLGFTSNYTRQTIKVIKSTNRNEEMEWLELIGGSGIGQGSLYLTAFPH